MRNMKPTYKSETDAEVSCTEETCDPESRMKRMQVVVLGSATPSRWRAMYRARNGVSIGSDTDNAAALQEMQQTGRGVHIVDMREELKNGNHSILSRKLQKSDGRAAGAESSR